MYSYLNSCLYVAGARSTNYQVQNEQYVSFEARLESFRHWPSQYTQTPLQLAEAGLYYMGTN